MCRVSDSVDTDHVSAPDIHGFESIAAGRWRSPSRPFVLVAEDQSCRSIATRIQAQAHEAGLAPEPLRWLDGSYCLHAAGGHWTRSRWQPGLTDNDLLTSVDSVRSLGALVGRIHDLDSASLELPATQPQPHHLTPVPSDLAPAFDSEVRTNLALAASRDTLRAVARYASTEGIIHGDIWPGNLVRASSGMHLVDWASARIGPQWYERLRALFWSVGLFNDAGNFKREAAVQYAAGYASIRGPGWYTGGDATDFATYLLTDCQPYTHHMAERFPSFAARRLRLARWLVRREGELEDLFVTAFSTEDRN